jgi:acetyltransferase
MASVKEKAPNASVNGILVQHMLPAGVEMILGVNSDPQFGPMLLVGLGGVFVEVFKDAALYPCPVGKTEAKKMLESLKAYKLLTGYRGGEPADIEALTDMMVAVSEFAVKNKNRLKELDINPVFVYPKGKGVAVADALVVLED